jgi:hypothetical protein
VDPRLLRALVSDDPRAPSPDKVTVVAHFRRVIENAWRKPSPETALAKRQLDFFCGHIDPMPELRSYIPVAVVADHYTALNSPTAHDRPSFTAALRLYLALLKVDNRNGPHGDEFRGASVALTFDSARHEANMLRFVDDGQMLVRAMRRDSSSRRQ